MGFEPAYHRRRPGSIPYSVQRLLSVVLAYGLEHHIDLIMGVADRIVVIDQGQRLAEGTPAEIQRNPAVLEAYLGCSA